MNNTDHRWAVVPHAERGAPTGRGYVVRSYAQGQCTDTYDYGGICPIKLYARQCAAQREADRLTRAS